MATIHFPKKVLLSITTHGVLKTWKSERGDIADTFRIPEDITLFKINVSSLGECNFMRPEVVKEFTSVVKRYEPYILRHKTKKSDKTLSKHKLESLSRTIRSKELKEEIKDAQNEVKNFFKQIKKGEKISDAELERFNLLSTYVDAYDRSYRVSVFSPGEITTNKTYSRTNVEATKTDWVIKALNMKGQPDILQYLFVQTRGGKSQITLQDLVDFLKSKGVEEIFLVDFSCSVFQDIDSYEDLSPRAVRRTRRDIISLKSHGGKKTKYNKKSRKNKTKKVRK
jgi:hypothetical protein